MKKFYCSAKEFYFNREFSTFLSAGEGKLNDALEGIQQKNSNRAFGIVLAGIATFLLFFFIPRLPAFTFQSEIRIGLGIILVLIIIFFYTQLYKGRKEYAEYRDRYFNEPTSLNEQVLYYVVSEKGIYINDYNREDVEEMTLLSWDGIEKAKVDFLRIPYVRGGTHNKAIDVFQNNIRSIKRDHADFDIEAKDKYDDRFALLLIPILGRGTHRSIPLPKEWRETGDEDRFLEEVGKYVPVSRGE